VDAHSFAKKAGKKFKQTLSACQKANGNCFLGQESSTDGGIHATKATVMSEVYCKTLKKNCVGLAIQNERRGMLKSNVVLLHDNVSLHTAAHT
jgi:hypothetical protein